MNNRCFLIAIALLFFVLSASAQIGYKAPVQNILNENFVMFNPAFFSGDHKLKASINKREWESESPIYPGSSVAVIDWTPNQGNTHLGLSGIRYGFDAFFLNTYGIHASRVFSVSEHLEVALGGRLNWVRTTWDPTVLMTIDQDDPLLMEKNSTNHLDGDVGVWFKGEKLYGGFALKHLLSPNADPFIGEVNYSGVDLFRPTMYLNLGYELALNNWSIEPRIHYEDVISSEIDYDNVSSANVLVGYKGKYYLGLGRWFSADGGTTTVMAKVQVKKMLGLYLSYAAGTHFNREHTRTHVECGANFTLWKKAPKE